ncbi:MAG: fibrillarin-like rRNA/tRNA 2'-O-methyltransferase [Candidatus Brockarchaeota archaeon]|nr:fibrillarin-like rRNA/tRNA 2'-O-methyltransferase [Candidatus Brockarchaeota archaeon]MBO3808445.1 fibrillarin-like rRNA/tRNA 2'-O-methyltransferase [Candidatus Brockarchaeota archaeon]
MVREVFKGVYEVEDEEGTRLATLSIAPGTVVYGEKTIRIGEAEYRVWNPYRSKIAAALLKGLRSFFIEPGWRILYLGAASGTTVSHVSDIVGPTGVVYAVEIAHRPFREFLEKVAGKRSNVVPILADARQVFEYAWLLEKVDTVYCDVAQPDEVDIAVRNADLFLREKGLLVVALKASSVDSTRRPSEIYRAEEARLEAAGSYRIEETVDLEPFAMMHELIVSRRA